jgi:hypothetical protein
VVCLAAALAVAYVAIKEPMYAALALAAAVLGLAVLVSPDLAAAAAVFLLYSNVVVVAVRFHGVPRIAGQAVVLLLVVPLVYELLLRRRRVVIHPALPLLALFGAIQALGVAFSRDAATSWEALVEYLVEGLLIFFLVTNAVRTPAQLRHATWALLLAGVAMSAVPIYQQLTGSFGDDYGGFGQTTELGFRTGAVTDRGAEVRQPRLSGTIGEQNRYAQNLLVLVPLGLALAWAGGSRRLRLAATGLAGFAALGCALAFSRGAALGFALLVATMALMRIVTLRQLAAVGLGTVILLAAMPQYWQRLTTLPDVTGLFASDVSHETAPDSAIKGRATEMLAAALVFADHPVIGVGPGMFKRYSAAYGNRLGIRRLEGSREAHSLFLGIAAETGAPGILCFLGVVGVTAAGLLRGRSRTMGVRPELAGPATGYFLALVAYLATGLFLHMAYMRFFYLVLGLAGAAALLADGHAHRLGAARPAADPAARPAGATAAPTEAPPDA